MKYVQKKQTATLSNPRTELIRDLDTTGRLQNRCIHCVTVTQLDSLMKVRLLTMSHYYLQELESVP